MSIMKNISRAKFILDLLEKADKLDADTYCSVYLDREDETHPITLKIRELKRAILKEIEEIDKECLE